MGEVTLKPGKRAVRSAVTAPTRARMIQVGTEVLSEKGFNSTGIDEILKRANAPKGSFYYYFESKQEFALAVIANYEHAWDKRLTRIFSDGNASPLQRIKNYIEEGMRGMEKYGFKRGCLIGNLGQELGGLNDAFRDRIEVVFARWNSYIRKCLDEAVRIGEIRSDVDTAEIARYFWIAWEGAILQCKLHRSVQPIEDFGSVLFKHVLTQGGTNV
jgi:TetR/AcrR family transcriptional repressor of nem operon